MNDAHYMLSELFEWRQANKRTLNVNKTCHTIFTNKKHIRDQKLIIYGTEIERVYCIKRLGNIS